MSAQVLPLFPEAKVTPRVLFGRTLIMELAHRAAELTGFSVSDLLARAGQRDIAWTRAAIMLVAHENGKSLTQIGRVFDGRDHTTVMCSLRTARESASKDADFVELVRLLRVEAAR